MTAADSVIQVKRAGIRFGDQPWIFRDVSLEVAPAESVSIIGPSGSGKSLLLRLIAGLLPPSEGAVAVLTDDLGMLFQRNALFDSLTVEENLLFPLRERKGIMGDAAKERAAAFLQAVGLRGTERLHPDELSGGMQKRLGIARALIVEPEVILYDEPTAGLDPITSRTIADLIRQLRLPRAEHAGQAGRAGTTVVCVTNDVQRAYQIGDRVCLLARGRLLDGGTPEQVQATRDPALRQFIYGLETGPLT